MHYYIINLLVNYFPREGWCMLNDPLLSLRLPIFINDNLLSFCRCLQESAAALCSRWQPRGAACLGEHGCLSPAVSPVPTSCMALTAMALFPTMWEGRQCFSKECAIPDKKEREGLKPGLPQRSVFLVSSWVAWEDVDLQAALCKQLLWQI